MGYLESPRHRTLSGGPPPFGKGAFGAGTDQPAPKSPPCPKNCLPAPSSAPCGGGPFRSGGAESPSHRLRRCQPPLARGPLERGRTSQRRKAPFALQKDTFKNRRTAALLRLIKQGGRTPAPCFSCSQRPQLAPLPIPRPAGRQSDGNSHGGQFPTYRQPIGGELPRSVPTFDPALLLPSDNRPAFTRGGPPASDTLTRHFVNNNKKTACVSGRNSVKYAYETAEAYKAGQGGRQPSKALCRRALNPIPTQQKFSAPKAHYNGFPGNNQWGNQWLVCVASAV